MDATTESSTDVIVRAMESAEDMAEVIVIWRTRNAGEDSAGVCWNSNASTFDALGMIEMAKAGLLQPKDRED